MELGYWNIHGLAQSIRFMLVASGEDFTQKFYELTNRPEWVEQDKPILQKSTPFANLPYLKHDGRVISESRAILKYLAAVLNDGAFSTDSNPDMLYKSEMVYGVLDEVWSYFRGFIFMSNEDFEKSKIEFHKKIFSFFEKFEEFLLKENSKFITGDKLTWVDFVLYENWLIFSKFSGAIAKLPFLTKFENSVNEAAGEKFVEYVAEIKKNMPILLPNISPKNFAGSIDEMNRQVDSL